MSERSSDETPVFFDLYSGSLLVGEAALDAHVEAMERGGFPADIIPIEHALNSNIDIPKGGFGSNINWTKEPLRSYTSAGQWLIKVAKREAQGGKYDASRHLIDRGNDLGITPSLRQITHPKRFSNLSEYYKSLGSANLKVGFPSLMPSDALLYLIRTSDSLGRVPSRPELDERARIDKDSISYHVLHERTGLGLKAFAREFGYWPEIDYSFQDCMDWGLNFMLANSGLLPTRSETDSLYSPQTKGPSSEGIKKYFGSFTTYHNALRVAYAAHLQLIEAARREADDKCPKELLASVRDDAEKLSFYGRYCAIKEVLPFLESTAIYELVKQNLSDAELIFNLKSYNLNVNADALSLSAAKAGLPRSVWRSPELINSLKVESLVLARLKSERGELSKEEEHEMEDAIAHGVDFLWANPQVVKDRLYWKKEHLPFLRSKGLIPTWDKFYKYFSNNNTFGELIWVGYHRQKNEMKIKEEELRAAISEGLVRNELPQELFVSAAGDHLNLDNPEALVRFAKYCVIKDLRAVGYLSALTTEKELEICTKKVEYTNFNGLVRSAANGDNLSAHEIELTASMLHLSEFVYPEYRQRHLERFVFRPKKKKKR